MDLTLPAIGNTPALPDLAAPAIPGSDAAELPADFAALIESLIEAETPASAGRLPLESEIPSEKAEPNDPAVAASADVAAMVASLPAPTPAEQIQEIETAEMPKALSVEKQLPAAKNDTVEPELALAAPAPAPSSASNPAPASGMPPPQLPDLSASAVVPPAHAPQAHHVAQPQHSAALAAPVATPQWNDELGAQIVVFAREGVQTAELRLDPPDLGPVEVRLSLERDTKELVVHFVASHAATREALEQALPRLREMMLEGGFSLNDASVADEGVSQRESTWENGGERRRDGDAEPHSTPRPHALPDRLIDTFA